MLCSVHVTDRLDSQLFNTHATTCNSRVSWNQRATGVFGRLLHPAWALLVLVAAEARSQRSREAESTRVRKGDTGDKDKTTVKQRSEPRDLEQ